MASIIDPMNAMANALAELDIAVDEVVAERNTLRKERAELLEWLCGRYEGTPLETLQHLDEQNTALRTRRDELLATIARISQSTPLESEVAEALEQRGKLLAEVGTLRSRVAELERLVPKVGNNLEMAEAERCADCGTWIQAGATARRTEHGMVHLTGCPPALDCGHPAGAHPDHRNYLEAAAERDGRVCKLGWRL